MTRLLFPFTAVVRTVALLAVATLGASLTAQAAEDLDRRVQTATWVLQDLHRLERLRQTFDSGKTRPIEWRQAQLFELGRMMRQHEADFAEALRLDLGKCLFEAVLTEMSFVEAEAKKQRSG